MSDCFGVDGEWPFVWDRLSMKGDDKPECSGEISRETGGGVMDLSEPFAREEESRLVSLSLFLGDGVRLEETNASA
ncbi:unnamed protein product [Somion occarium]|uniref:Uncharacterized protein n=1 Tax=Somion occarium TaxID=3059160 RepID=A0ABP1CNP3_9APHY